MRSSPPCNKRRTTSRGTSTPRQPGRRPAPSWSAWTLISSFRGSHEWRVGSRRTADRYAARGRVARADRGADRNRPIAMGGPMRRTDTTSDWREYWWVAQPFVVAILILLAAVWILASMACGPVPVPTHPPQPPPVMVNRVIQVQVTPDGVLQQALKLELTVDPPFGAQPTCLSEGVALACPLKPTVTPPYGAHLYILVDGFDPVNLDFVLSGAPTQTLPRSEEHTSELQSQSNLVC